MLGSTESEYPSLIMHVINELIFFTHLLIASIVLIHGVLLVA